MKKFNIGDAVIKKSIISKYDKATIIQKLDERRYVIKLKNHYNISGLNTETWVDISEIEIDKEYYRDLKINDLLS